MCGCPTAVDHFRLCFACDYRTAFLLRNLQALNVWVYSAEPEYSVIVSGGTVSLFCEYTVIVHRYIIVQSYLNQNAFSLMTW